MKPAVAALAALSALILTACSAERTPTPETAPAGESPATGEASAPTPPAPTPTQPAEVPARFQGTYAPDEKACARDYAYNPAFLTVTVNGRDVHFFETGGPVTNVNVEGDSIAITLRETVGDAETTRAIYLVLVDDRTARYRPSDGEPVKTYVRCSANS